MEWKKFIDKDLPVPTPDDFSTLEAELGVKFPDDVRSLISEHQGQVPEKRMIESDELAQVHFGPVLHVDKYSNDPCSLRYSFNKWKEYYENLIPIVRSGQSGCVFALDYQSDKENPLIVFIDANGDPEDKDSILFVANNISELIGNLSDPK